jgi:phosphoglycerate dehydrogenase-like enzyme
MILSTATGALYNRTLGISGDILMVQEDFMSTRVYVLSRDDARQLDAFRRHAPAETEIVWVDVTQPLDHQAAQLREATAVIVMPSAFPVDLALKCPNLKLIQTVSAGTNLLDIPALSELGIRVANNGGGNAVAVAEHTITLMVSVYRKMHLQFQSVKDRQWAGDLRATWLSQAYELTDKTVGIIGLGRIGQRVARRLQGWDCRLIYHDVVSYAPELEHELHITRVGLDELLRTSDIVTLHVPLTRQTRGMISDREFGLMKPTAVLINACRGPVVDEAALIRAMRANKILGAGLDVLEQEPTPADNPLLGMDNVVVTPHLAALAQESFEKSRAFAVQNAAGVAGGDEPESVVDYS